MPEVAVGIEEETVANYNTVSLRLHGRLLAVIDRVAAVADDYAFHQERTVGSGSSSGRLNERRPRSGGRRDIAPVAGKLAIPHHRIDRFELFR